MKKRAAYALILGIIFVPIVVVLAGRLGPSGAPGRLVEEVVMRPPDLEPVELVDATERWELAEWQNDGATEFAGGISVGDIDGDGMQDFLATGGSLTVFFSERTHFESVSLPRRISKSEVVSSAIADLDADGLQDVVMGMASGGVVIGWGGPHTVDRHLEFDEVTSVPAGDVVAAVVPVDLDGDRLLEIVVLGYGDQGPAPDVIASQVSARSFETSELPGSRRRSLAAGVADLDLDGALEIWVTRDIGWVAGGDSLYTSRDGWHTVVDTLSDDIEIDGMGVAIADLDLDGLIDVYLSDLGDNEFISDAGGSRDSAVLPGAARIRPPGAERSMVSSSWATGIVDLNLDGRLDIVVANGGFTRPDIPNKIRGTVVASSDPPAILLGTGEGTYVDAWPALRLEWVGAGRGLGVADFDADGDTDLVFATRDRGLRAYENRSASDALTVTPAPGCDGFGAIVAIAFVGHSAVTALAGQPFLGSLPPHLTIGATGVGRVTVKWADGSRTSLAPPSRSARNTVSVPC